MTTPEIDRCLRSVLCGERPEQLPPSIRDIELRSIGEILIRTGEIVACDPLVFPDQPAFARKTPIGRFPVDLFIAHYEDGDQRIAAARLQFAPGMPSFWELAVTEAQDISTLQPGEIFGYAVDAGMGSFMDLEAAERLRFRMSEEEDFFLEIIDRMDENYESTRSWTTFKLGDDGLDFAAFSSGGGDGFYASYWGLSSDGLKCLVTDFRMLYCEEEAAS